MTVNDILNVLDEKQKVYVFRAGFSVIRGGKAKILIATKSKELNSEVIKIEPVEETEGISVIIDVL